MERVSMLAVLETFCLLVFGTCGGSAVDMAAQLEALGQFANAHGIKHVDLIVPIGTGGVGRLLRALKNSEPLSEIYVLVKIIKDYEDINVSMTDLLSQTGPVLLHALLIDQSGAKLQLDRNSVSSLASVVSSTSTTLDFWVLGGIPPSLYEAVAGSGVNLDSNVFVYEDGDLHPDTIVMKELYRIKSTEPLIISDFGSWSPEDGLDINTVQKYIRRRDLRGTLIRTGVETWLPYIRAHESEEGEVSFIDGYFGEIFYHLQEITNFTYTAIRPGDAAWGALLPNGSWSGMIGQLTRDETDIAPAGFVVTDDRRKAVDFLVPILQSDGRIFFRNPNQALNWFAYFTPLLWQVWAAILVLLVIMPVAISLSANYPLKDAKFKEFTLIKSYIFVFGALTFGRRWGDTPSTLSTRVIFFLTSLVGILIHWHWKAGIISQLTVYQIAMPFQDLEGVLRSDFQLLIYPSGNLATSFQTTDDPVWNALYMRDLRANLEEWPNDYESLIELSISDDYAFLEYYEGPVPLSKPFLNCRLVSTTKPLIPAKHSFALQKNSPFSGLFNFYTEFLIEKGILDKIFSYYKMHRPDASMCGGGKGQPIGVNDAISALMVFLLGLSGAGILFFLEVLSSVGRRK